MKRLAKLLHPATIISTFFYVGKIPFMPGTWGSIAASLVVAFIFYQPYLRDIDGQLVIDYGSGIIHKDLILVFLIAITVISIVLGTWAADVHEKICNKKDPGEIVIDEVAGIFLATSLVAIIYAGLIHFDAIQYTQILIASPLFLVMILILFRIYDIWKPNYINWAQHYFKGGLGVMADDLIAGVYTAVTFYIIFFTAKYFGFFNFYFSRFFGE